MRDIQVNKDELIKILENNKKSHRKVYEEARENYLKAAAEELEKRLDAINAGRMISLIVNLPVPEDHTRDYERVIKMLGMEERDSILLSEGDYQQYVQDDWAWRRAWVANTVSYTAGASLDHDEDEYA